MRLKLDRWVYDLRNGLDIKLVIISTPDIQNEVGYLSKLLYESELP